ncbi:TfoX/Sxy family protein [Methylobacterium sp. Leaf118]|uniref:TfoX/Sxy family protein n=1 Tax=Methylobacterium sp. Leaf118 TaxID=2876562 RepID=UPI001E5FA292|nr:TfoX/Sxy family protein [Methylobacterium sp. Leaf118]
MDDPAACYAALRAAFPDPATVSEMRGFGAKALTVDGRIAAMLDADRLVVKLPRAQVDALVAAGLGTRFDGHRGQPMAEWLSVGFDQAERWQDLAREAYASVASNPAAPRA